MAKKNSSKTATEKSIQASEPKVQIFTGWQGINIKDAPLGWRPLETGYHDHKQTDLRPNYLMLQNNMVTDDAMTIQTRPTSKLVANPPSGYKFTGVEHVHDRWIFLAVRTNQNIPSGHTFLEKIAYAQLPDWDSTISTWRFIELRDPEVIDHQNATSEDPDYNVYDYEICEIRTFEKKIIATTRHPYASGDYPVPGSKKATGEIFFNSFNESWNVNVTYDDGIKLSEKGITIGKDNDADHEGRDTRNQIWSPRYVNNPNRSQDHLEPTITGHGMQTSSTYTSGMVSRVEAKYIYTNSIGMTLASRSTSLYTDTPMVTYSSEKYITISGHLPAPALGSDYWTIPMIRSITGVDVYVHENDEQNWGFAGHVDLNLPLPADPWSVNYLGPIDNVDDWDLRDHDLPQENSTKGAPAAHFEIHDSRLYYWGNPDKPYRLYIGGVPGAELSIARGYGGAWIDIEPGTGLQINGTAK